MYSRECGYVPFLLLTPRWVKAYTVKFTEKSKVTIKKTQTVYAQWKKISVGTPTLKSVKNSSKDNITFHFSLVSGARGYEIVISEYADFNHVYDCRHVSSVTKEPSASIDGWLKKGRTYYVKVRAYKRDSKKINVYGKFSAVKKVKVTK